MINDPICVCYGADHYRVHVFIESYKKTFLSKGMDDTSLVHLDLSKVNIAQVIEEASTYPFFGDKKLIIVEDNHYLTTGKETTIEHDTTSFLAYLEDPNPTTYILFWVKGEKLDERKKVVKALKKKAKLYAFAPMKAIEIPSWVKEQAKKAECEIEPNAVHDLIERVGENSQMLWQEIQKLSLYVGRDGVITCDLVAQAVGRGVSHHVFALTESIAKQDFQKAWSIFQELQLLEEPIKVLMLLAKQFRLMIQVQSLSRQGYSQAQMASQLSAHPYTVKLAAQQSQAYSSQALLQIIERIADLDVAIKSGKVGKKFAIEWLILHIKRACMGN